jgi:hypothetical protein
MKDEQDETKIEWCDFTIIGRRGAWSPRQAHTRIKARVRGE